MIKVVAALIEKEGKYLIARRSTGDENVLGKWEFPGGKVQDGETEEHAIEREIKEELNYSLEKAINIVIQIDRLSDGKRKVSSISEVVGLKDDKVKLKEIFAFKENGLSEHGEVRGEFILYKYIPKVYDKMKRKGIVLKDIFGD